MKDHSYGVCIYRTAHNSIEVLMMQPKGSTQWGFIKGKIEKGEHTKECAVRECQEETGIVIDPRDLDNMFFKVSKRKNIGIFLVKEEYVDMSNIVLCEKETEDIKLYDLYGDIDIHKNQELILEDIRKYFSKHRELR